MVEHDVANGVVVGSNPITRFEKASGPREEAKGLRGATLWRPGRRLPRLWHLRLWPLVSSLLHRSPWLKNSNLEDTADEADAEAAAEEERIPLEPRRENRPHRAPASGARHRHGAAPTIHRTYFSDKPAVLKELMPTAAVPGFRAGRAPRKLVEHRFRKDVADQVKGSLLMDSLSQVTEEQKLAAISEPDLDVTAVELPDEGPMTFEFDLEVRPEFDLPQWKGLTIERQPTSEFSSADIDQELRRDVGVAGPVGAGRWHAGRQRRFHHRQYHVQRRRRAVVSEAPELSIRVAASLSFRDGKIDGFGKAIGGVKAGETRTRAGANFRRLPANESLRTAEANLRRVQRAGGQRSWNCRNWTPEFLS